MKENISSCWNIVVFLLDVQGFYFLSFSPCVGVRERERETETERDREIEAERSKRLEPYGFRND